MILLKPTTQYGRITLPKSSSWLFHFVWLEIASRPQNSTYFVQASEPLFSLKMLEILHSAV